MELVPQRFEGKVRYEKTITDPNDKDCGKTKKITETYLVDALSYTEAEANLTERMIQFGIKGDFRITNLKPASYAEILLSEDDQEENWFVCKIRLTIIDESSDKIVEKKVTQTLLQRAPNINIALERLNEFGKGYQSDFSIVGINESQIIDYLRYEVKEDTPNNSNKSLELEAEPTL